LFEDERAAEHQGPLYPGAAGGETCGSASSAMRHGGTPSCACGSAHRSARSGRPGSLLLALGAVATGRPPARWRSTLRPCCRESTPPQRRQRRKVAQDTTAAHSREPCCRETAAGPEQQRLRGLGVDAVSGFGHPLRSPPGSYCATLHGA
jgi:hypothetical protein